MAEKKTTTKKAAAEKVAAPKKAPAKKACATKKEVKATVAITEENIGFKAGDVYQAVAKAEEGLTVAQIAKNAKISTEEVYLGLGWLMKEGKLASVDNKVVLK